ncbi:fatty acid synthase subunit beta dehydratase [Pyrenophora tritici-repentis Pt-1C-BFP]|uniref:S-acyl fatty acid synthase thioesterase n=1 Tax=Pyrenophora tritici-repentis (strain Pt-1C-BFP) TaxID=426418 RepID=B2WGP2_PYRTR|nr:fatty acid synthase subunit beta dehydratase [Pyrenophora tritici-repentis Pt-1C-BFP]EDU42149.1 fatty acid synthase subunit beta dehydratase [Pyrenophora tritici-repentis Pt-1C-BFP]
MDSDMSFHFSSSSPYSLCLASTPGSVRSTRLEYLSLAYEWHIPEVLQGHVFQLWEKFTADLRIKVDGIADPPASVLELLSQFLLHVMRYEQDEPQGLFQSNCLELLLAQIESDFLGDSSIQSIVSDLPGTPLQRQNVIQAYVAANQHIRQSSLRTAPRTALFDQSASQTTQTYAIFGGQGNTSDYLQELRSLFDTYTHVVEPILATAEDTLRAFLRNASSSCLKHFKHGLEITQWLQRPEGAPSKNYLLSAPVSFPLIGLLQFATYAVICWSLKKTPGEVTHIFKGMAGHSQGVVVAATLSTTTTWESLHYALVQALTVLFEIGVAAQEATPDMDIPASVIAETTNAGEGSPTPMLNVAGCDLKRLQSYMNKVNGFLNESQRVSIALINGRTNFVVAGPTLSVCALARTLRRLKASPEEFQDKKPFSSRKPEFSLQFLPISAPFHTPHLDKAVPGVLAALESVRLCPSSFRVPVYHTHTGKDLRQPGAESIIPDLVKMILCEVDDWPLSTGFKAATHAVDFGPGGPSGVCSLLLRNKEGTGLRVILAGLAESASPELGDMAELLSAKPTFGADWVERYSPRLVQTEGGIEIRNKMTRLLGLPPLMVAAMTPTTASWEFVSAIVSAGYHVEFAAGGLHTAESFTDAIKSLASSIPSGRGICINIIYASPRQVRWQLPLIRKLRSEGFPIDGITFGAGVPSTEALREYLDIGLKYLSFKPGSTSSISQVIAIARMNPDVPIVLQWTSGRGGGHHSYEDFHDPIIKMYAKIRRCDNIVLLAGSGFGGADDTYPYLSGNWALRFGLQPMPFDGVLFGSRMMVAKEAKTSQGAKEAIVAAPGIDDEASWEQSYKTPVGGIVTVKSEMGEPIHKLATRGVLLWRELDGKIFSISDRTQRLAKLLQMKSYIIKRLNDDFQRVWFGVDSQGNAVDLEDMTYADILHRLIQLCYVAKESRWIDKGYKQLTADFVRRMCSRLQRSVPPKLDMEEPLQVLKEVVTFCKSADKVVAYSDARYFLLLCKRQGQKPPPFVPALDEDFETWFKKDSLWQSEDLAAVVDEDAQRTCILQGPVAAGYSTKINEPVAEILGNISQQHVSRILREVYDSDETLLPVDEQPVRCDETSSLKNLPECCRISQQGSETAIYINERASQDRLPHIDDWARALAGADHTWLSSLLMSEDIVRDKMIIPNPIRKALAPLPGIRVELFDATSASEASLIVYEKASSSEPSLEIRKEGDLIFVTMFVHESVGKSMLTFCFRFTYRSDTPLHPIHEISEGRNEMLQEFYDGLWFGSERHQVESGTLNLDLSKLVVESQPTKISPSLVQAFMDSIEQPDQSRTPRTSVPLDHCIVVAWEAMMKATFAGASGCDFLSLVHLSNKFKVLDERPLDVSNKVTSTAEIKAIRNLPAGRAVEVVATITRDGLPAVEVTSEFLFRGTYTDFRECFERRMEPKIVVTINRMADIAVLKSKAWVSLEQGLDYKSLLGQRLVFDLHTLGHLASATTYRSLQVCGHIFIEDPETKVLRAAGEVRYYSAGPTISNPVLDYLNRCGTQINGLNTLPIPQPLGGKSSLSVSTPLDNHAYARASGDFNPIHVSQTVARYANLPGPITHGMYTSAAVRQVVEKAAGCSNKVHMRSYKASFVNMVLPNSVLDIQIHHTAMKDGLRILNFQAVHSESKQVVLEGEAEVDQLLTAYVFTGQGSQKQDMGMDLYTTSEVARQVWDEADRFYSETYGFLISDIVKQNPKQLTVFFGGRRGRKLRENYMKMTVESIDGRPERFFKSITPTTTSYTFQHNAGLLFSTEFAQPALTVMERAQFLHLKSQGLVTSSALFAGHSLGEYTSLSTIGEIMPFQSLLSVVFYRGLTMRSAVKRDAQGRSKFAMVAVNPSRANTTPAVLLKLVTSIASTLPDDLLEVVNHNVETQQYVAAGTLKALACLGDVMDYVAKNRKLSPEDLAAFVTSRAAAITDQMPELKRGVATIPLEGIDVPFHSSFLLPKMPAFRRVLQQYIEPKAIDSRRLVGKYISNVTGKPFDISYKGVSSLQRLTGSTVLQKLIVEMVA